MEQKKTKGATPPPLRYDAAFKTEAVRLVTEQGCQPTEVAAEPTRSGFEAAAGSAA